MTNIINDLTGNFIFRPYQTGDEEKIVSLLNLVFNSWPNFDVSCKPIDHWKWKFIDNPLKASKIAISSRNNDIIGCSHLLPRKLKIRDKVYISYYGVDVAVHPDFRGIGIYKKLNEIRFNLATKAGIDFSFHSTGNPVLLKHHLKYWQRFPYPIINLVWIQNVEKQLKAMPMKKAWILKYGYLGAQYLNKLKNSLLSHKSLKFKGIIKNIWNFDARIDDFWEEVSRHYDFIVERKQNYLNWRYCDSRSGKFVIKQAEKDDRILGYIVLSINKKLENYPIGFVVDLLTIPYKINVVNALIADAIRYFKNKKINLINYLVMRNHPYEKIFKRNGFINSRLKFHLFYKRHEEDKKNKLKNILVKQIYFTWGDHDTLPINIPHY